MQCLGSSENMYYHHYTLKNHQKGPKFHGAMVYILEKSIHIETYSLLDDQGRANP